MKIKFAVFFILSFCLINLVFAESNPIANLGFDGFKNPQSCYAMGLSEEDFSGLIITTSLSRIKTPTQGLPVIIAIRGIDVPNLPEFTPMGLRDIFGYITGQHPIQIRVGIAGKSLILGFISMEKPAQASRYTGDLRLDDNQGRYCIIHLLQRD